jgi:NAD(P)-dependent dehydrogenase (short-subunit alcohol dehydrogenase family)
MEVVIVTGASKGLGAALVEQLLSSECRVIAISRTPNDALADSAREKGAWLDWYLQDLSNLDATDALARTICDGLPLDATTYALVNNAATIEPVGAVARIDPASVTRALALNVGAAMLFTARFLEATDALKADRRVLNISSGSGRRPMDGNGVYSATKAALDMFTRCAKAEQVLRPEGMQARMVTDMQVQARSQDPALFPQTAFFRKMKDDGILAEPADAARRIAAFLFRDDFGTTEIDDIRNY